MRAFTDCHGRKWNVPIHAASLGQVREVLGVDLLEVFTGNLAGRLAEDVVLLVNILYVVCSVQADARGVSDVEFGESLGGDAIDEATVALLDALIDFLPAKKRKPLHGLHAMIKKLRQAAHGPGQEPKGGADGPGK